MARKRDYELLARLKSEVKEKQDRISRIQTKILENNPTNECSTDYGTLQLVSKRNIEVPDNSQLIKNSSLTQTIFINSAKFSISTLEKIVGKNELEQLIENGTLARKSDTKYYKLSPLPKN